MKVTQEQVQHRIADSIDKVAASKSSLLKKYFDFAAKDNGLKEISDKAVEAGILGNFQKVMDSDAVQNFITTNNYGPYVMEIWPIVTAWYPEFPLKDLVSVQNMDKPLAYLFFSSLKQGTKKGDSPVGATVETPLGMREIRGNYPTGEVFGEEIPEDQIQEDGGTTITMLAYAPLNVQANYLEKYKIQILDEKGAPTKTYTAGSVVGGDILLNEVKGDGTVEASEAKIEIQTGAVTLPDTGVKKIKANYVWMLELSNDDNIPTVTEDIEMIPIEAIPRALALKWTVFSEYLKKSQFNLDIREDTTKRVLNLIYQYQVRYVLDDLYDYATGHVETIEIPQSQVLALDVKNQKVQEQAKKVANTIEITSGRMEGNRIVCGVDFKSYLESLPDTMFKPETQENSFSGPRKIGTWGTFSVYYDPYRRADEGFMTYRGDQWYDSAYYIGMYMPIIPTDAVAIGTKIRSAFCSMEAYFYHKKNSVIPLKFAKVGA